MLFNNHYIPSTQDMWKGRTDEREGERFHQHVRVCSLEVDKLVFAEERPRIGLLGFASDKGIRKNYGREGAVEGPREFRKTFASLPVHPKTKNALVYDFGDIHCGEDLSVSQKYLGKAVAKIIDLGFTPFLIGGGGEMVWGHYQGLACRYPKISIVNFDAHFDLRFVDEGPNSGTPFLQIAEYCLKDRRPFNYHCYGIQKMNNSSTLFETAENLGVHYLLAHDIQGHKDGLQQSFLQSVLSRSAPIYVSIDLSVFNSGVAPGVSSVNPLGLMPAQILTLLEQLIKSGKVAALDIAELSPKHDRYGITGRLAATIMAHALEWHCHYM